ncbi:hypothetical protein JTB14_020813 [Gonioctena quinquepunctata]|nr:hypothetical protein JTB14_020813 [Gonioctena quinquepunctata]
MITLSENNKLCNDNELFKIKVLHVLEEGGEGEEIEEERPRSDPGTPTVEIHETPNRRIKTQIQGILKAINNYPNNKIMRNHNHSKIPNKSYQATSTNFHSNKINQKTQFAPDFKHKTATQGKIPQVE